MNVLYTCNCFKRVLPTRLPSGLFDCERVGVSDPDDGRTAVERPAGEVAALAAREGNHALRREVEADAVAANRSHGRGKLQKEQDAN